MILKKMAHEMLKLYEETIESDFNGTIIDVETIGYFEWDKYPDRDTRQYRQSPTIFGFITRDGITIHYVKKKQDIPSLIDAIPEVLSRPPRPYHAFNAPFETAVFYNNCDIHILFDHELNLEQFEGKAKAVRKLGISNYNDPFDDIGKLCMEAWRKGEIEKCLAHNRACLLKERDILLKRGYRSPDEVVFIPLEHPLDPLTL